MGIYTDLVLGLCLLILMTSEHFRFITETAGQRQGQRSRKKRCQKRGQKLSTAELAAMVRQMFPERPEPDKCSRARAVAVKALEGSARGLFALLPEKVCVNIVSFVSLRGVLWKKR